MPQFCSSKSQSFPLVRPFHATIASAFPHGGGARVAIKDATTEGCLFTRRVDVQSGCEFYFGVVS